MKKIAKLLLMCLMVAGSAIGAPDYEPVKKAMTDFTAVLNELNVLVPKIHDSASAISAMDLFTNATNAYTDAVLKMTKENPAIATIETPPEIVDAVTQLLQTKNKYPELGANLGRAAARFKRDPEVRAAIERMLEATKQVKTTY